MNNGNIFEVTDENYESIIEGKPILIDFWAPWCSPCRVQGPIIEEIAEKYSGTVRVGKCNIEENPEAASALNIQSIPTCVLYQDRELVEIFTGLTPAGVFTGIIEEVILENEDY